jgi:hypothetical protein
LDNARIKYSDAGVPDFWAIRTENTFEKSVTGNSLPLPDCRYGFVIDESPNWDKRRFARNSKRKKSASRKKFSRPSPTFLFGRSKLGMVTLSRS